MFRQSAPNKSAYASRFPKPKDEQWWVVLGDPATGELLALKRISRMGRFQTTSMTFEWDEDWDPNLKDIVDQSGKTVPGYTFSIYLICDSYIGVDMQYSFDVAKPEEQDDDEEDEEESEGNEEM